MKIGELVENKEFEFNTHFRIYKYIPTISNEEGEVVLEYDSYIGDDISHDILDKDISAINQGLSGVVEIEHL